MNSYKKNRMFWIATTLSILLLLGNVISVADLDALIPEVSEVSVQPIEKK